MINKAEVNYISTAGTVSKKGFHAYKGFINSMNARYIKENNNTQQSTVWENIKKRTK